MRANSAAIAASRHLELLENCSKVMIRNKGLDHRAPFADQFGKSRAAVPLATSRIRQSSHGHSIQICRLWHLITFRPAVDLARKMDARRARSRGKRAAVKGKMTPFHRKLPTQVSARSALRFSASHVADVPLSLFLSTERARGDQSSPSAADFKVNDAKDAPGHD
jgi:hypothetical protein